MMMVDQEMEFSLKKKLKKRGFKIKSYRNINLH